MSDGLIVLLVARVVVGFGVGLCLLICLDYLRSAVERAFRPARGAARSECRQPAEGPVRQEHGHDFRMLTSRLRDPKVPAWTRCATRNTHPAPPEGVDRP